ncbi:NEAT domain-containing protein [Clostridium sp. HCP1S3_B4]|uniref:NEAT domain-containing protein n=1 Tax=unclassified Clostridium TaxID=2614128 RepID=UPI002A7A7676|nr:NEAT domain-containing protein [Clostridium sp.]
MRKIISIILITVFIVTFTLENNYVFAEANLSNISEKNQDILFNSKFKNGEYKVKVNVLKVDSDDISSAAKYIDNESDIIITDNGVKAIVNFNKRKLMTNIVVKINGKEVNYETREEGNDNLYATIPLEDADNIIEVSSKINTGFMVMPVSFRIIFDTSTIPLKDLINNNPPEDDNKNNSDDNTSNNKPENIPSNDKIEEPEKKPEMQEPSLPSQDANYSIYKIQNEIITSSSIGYTAARAAISTSSYVEKYDDNTYITLGISNLDVMNNIRVSVNNRNIAYEIVRQNDSNYTMDIRFKVNSIKDDIKVNAYINAIGMDISFGIQLLENSMELISSSESSKPLASISSVQPVPEFLGGETVNNEKINNKELSEDIKIEMKNYYKKYTIENEIISDSTIGRNMARKYIDKTCILDEIDGQYYLTIKISGSNSMGNIKVEVNNEEIEYEIVSKDNDGNMAIRFKINGIDDSIKMYMLISAVNKNVDFGIKLLKDTMVLIDEGVASNSNDENNKDELLENFMKRSNDEVGSNKKAIMVSSAATMTIIFLLEGIVFAIIKRKKKIKKQI